MCPGRGECGRGSVGELLLVRIRLFLLLLLQLLVRLNMAGVGR